MLAALAPLLGAGISGLFSWFGGQRNSENTNAANLMNFQLAQAQMAQQAQQFAQAQEFAERQFAASQASQSDAQAFNRAVWEDSRRRSDLSASMAEADRNANLAINASNVALQREFAQNGVSWRVADAARAGIHPLAALGGSGASFSPVAHISGGSIAGTQAGSTSGGSWSGGPSPGSGSGGGGFIADTSMGNALSSMGQDVSRAIEKSLNAGERADAYTAAMQVANLEKAGLENQLLRSQIAKNRQQSSPPMPVGQRYLVDGQGQAAGGSSTVTLVENKPLERTPGAPGAPHQEPAAITDVGFARTPTGWATVPSKDVKERIEDNLIYEVQHFIRNNVAPLFSKKHFSPPAFSPGRGKMWTHNPILGEYQATDTPFERRFTGRR